MVGVEIFNTVRSTCQMWSWYTDPLMEDWVEFFARGFSSTTFSDCGPRQEAIVSASKFWRGAMNDGGFDILFEIQSSVETEIFRFYDGFGIYMYGYSHGRNDV